LGYNKQNKDENLQDMRHHCQRAYGEHRCIGYVSVRHIRI